MKKEKLLTILGKDASLLSAFAVLLLVPGESDLCRLVTDIAMHRMFASYPYFL